MPVDGKWSYQEILDIMGRSIQKITVLRATEEFFRELGEKLMNLVLNKDQIKQVYNKLKVIKEMLLEKDYKEDGDAYVVLDEIKKAFNY